MNNVNRRKKWISGPGTQRGDTGAIKGERRGL